MMREFHEETGLLLTPGTWRRFCVLRGHNKIPGTHQAGCETEGFVDAQNYEEWEVHFFTACLKQELLAKASTMEHEEIVLKYVESIGVENAIPNLPWLITMARCMDNDLHFPVKEYIVSEQY